MSTSAETGIRMTTIEPTVFLRRSPSGLEQRVRLTVANSGEAVSSATCEVQVGGDRYSFPLTPIPAGESTHDIFLKERSGAYTATAEIKIAGKAADSRSVEIRPPRHWVVHVVHESHHDIGYTDLASNVLREHDRNLDRVIEFAAATNDFPEDSRFRMIVEQAWSVDHYLKTAPAARASAMIDLMKSGRVELTALFGNMTTETCGHETLARSVYHAFRLKREYGIPIISAEHNDIPGFAWGLATVLTEAGIKIFCPELPKYYHWGATGSVRSFWDQTAIFGYDGPGAFWWEAPSGKRILLWNGDNGCGGDCRLSIPHLEGNLAKTETIGFPFSVFRWPVSGAARDNSPYLEGYPHTIRKWNETWAYPHLVCSTNAMFYQDLVKQLPADLPVHRGDLPGQDYPLGSLTTSAPTAVNRNNHTAFQAAERLATISRAVTGMRDRQAELNEANEEVLWYDEHVWGHHFPCGPTNRASEVEKAMYAYRAAALIHDVSAKAMAAVADRVRIDESYPHLVVFNPHSFACGGIVRTPLREIDNCGSEIVPVSPQDDPQGVGHLRGVLLNDHWHVNPDMNFVDGLFDLVDVATGATVPFEIMTIDSADLPVPFAAQRLGIGSGGKRYGFFEMPTGLKRELIFKVDEVPACGYRTFGLRPRTSTPAFVTPFTVADDSIENEYYRIRVDRSAGTIVSIYDKEAKAELIDRNSPYALGDVLVRFPDKSDVIRPEDRRITGVTAGPMTASVHVTMRVSGHPHIRQVLTLYSGEKRIDVAMHVLKDPTPLADVHAAFPLTVPSPEFRYENVLSVVDPATDYLPGAYLNSTPVQNWVRVSNNESAVVWSSLDTPIVSLGGLWALAVSPAHRCMANAGSPQPPASAKDLKHGWIFSTLFANNFGTNFSVSQNGSYLFRYSLTSGAVGNVSPERFGLQAVMPFGTIFTLHHRARSLPAQQGFLQIDPPSVHLLTCKQAEDGRGYILRLWNPGKKNVRANVRVGFTKIAKANLTNLAEEDLAESVSCREDGLTVDCQAGAVVTIRIISR